MQDTEVKTPTGVPPEVAAEVVAVSRGIREEIVGSVRFALSRALALVGAATLLIVGALVWIALEVRTAAGAAQDATAQLVLIRERLPQPERK